MTRLLYVLRHLFLGWLMVALLAANLYVDKPSDDDPWSVRTITAVDRFLSPWSGALIERIGLRQYWVMFAPNPTHYGGLVEAIAIDEGGERRLGMVKEPPATGFYVMLGYNRIAKFQKKAYLEPKRYAGAYAEAICRTEGLHGRVKLVVLRTYPPSPSRRVKGWAPMRVEEPLGVWSCP